MGASFFVTYNKEDIPIYYIHMRVIGQKVLLLMPMELVKY